MKKYKSLLKNIGLLGISQFGTKFLSFFLVPLYTSCLTTAEYGIYDLINTTISLMIPICTLNIMQSVMRFSLDKFQDKKTVFTVGIQIYSCGLIFICFLLLINNYFNIISVVCVYWIYFLLIYILISFQDILISFARGLNNILTISINGVLNTILTIVFNILFLVVFKMRLTGYFLASILGLTGNIIYLIIKLEIWKYFSLTLKDSGLRKDMLFYSIPLIFNSIAWWINNVSDRYVITFLCGIAANGIYSVAYKIPNILNIFQTIFNQAWVISTVDNYDKEDSGGFFSNTYNIYNFGMVVICSLLIITTKLLAYFLYAKDFYKAWIYVPFLAIAIIFGAMSGCIGGIFSAVKNSKVFSYTTILGAVTNIILNFILVKQYGVIGAAIATMVSYYIVWLARLLFVRRYMKLKINLLRDHIAYILLLIQTIIILMLESSLWMYILECSVFVLILFIYRHLIHKAYILVKMKFKAEEKLYEGL